MQDNTRIRKWQMTEAEKGWNIQRILRERLGLSKREISRCKQFEDGMTVEGEKVLTTDPARPGAVLQVVLHEDLAGAELVIPVDGPLSILYEDEDLIAVNKEAGLVVHPGHDHQTDSVCNRLAWHYAKTGEQHIMRVVGRLDRETSGVLVFGKNRASAAAMTRQMREGIREKEYLALCQGIPASAEGTIDTPIGNVPGVRMLRHTCSPTEGGESAVTHYRVLRSVKVPEKGSFSLVSLQLETGRTHQIRVHMASIGHPLLADSLYADPQAQTYGMRRCALHASRMTLFHPVTGEGLAFHDEMPEDMSTVLQSHAL